MPIDSLEAFPGRLEISRQQAALQQIDMAVEMMRQRQWACAITLALAAESQLPTPEKPFVQGVLAERHGKSFVEELNEPRNWLKHAKEPNDSVIFEMDAVVAILRAISKFTSLYGAWSEDMEAFDAWVKQQTRSEAPAEQSL